MEQEKYPIGWTSVEQSDRLVKAGLYPQTCDMTYSKNGDNFILTVEKSPSIEHELFSYRNGYEKPCWSLGRLISLLPKTIPYCLDSHYTLVIKNCWIAYEVFDNADEETKVLKTFVGKDIIDCAVAMLEWILENGYMENSNMFDIDLEKCPKEKSVKIYYPNGKLFVKTNDPTMYNYIRAEIAHNKYEGFTVEYEDGTNAEILPNGIIDGNKVRNNFIPGNENMRMLGRLIKSKPNPFNVTTHIEYASQYADKLYDALYEMNEYNPGLNGICDITMNAILDALGGRCFSQIEKLSKKSESVENPDGANNT